MVLTFCKKNVYENCTVYKNDNEVFLGDENEVFDDIDYTSINPRKISKMIDHRYRVKTDEKFINAEVPTPRGIRGDMLRSFPISFWKNKHNTVFEPTSGKGCFVVSIINKFLKGLKIEIPDFKKRYKFIVENCVFWNDINKENVRTTIKLIDPSGKYNLRYSNLDSLTIFDTQKIYGVPGFNAVIGNPPYNPPSGTNTGKSIWQKFVGIALESWILDKGFLSYVHPNGWRKPYTSGSNLSKLFKPLTQENWMVVLEMHGLKDGMNNFLCGTRYDWYLVKKVSPDEKLTRIKDYNDKDYKISLKGYTWLSNYNVLFGNKISNKENKVSMLDNGSAYAMNQPHTKDTPKNSVYKYRCIHTIPKSGVRYIHSSRNDKGHFGVPKVIVALANPTNPIKDITGEFCITSECVGITASTKKELNEIYKAFKSSKFKKHFESFLFRNYALDKSFFVNLNKDFYKEF
jgi:hypothetical protein